MKSILPKLALSVVIATLAGLANVVPSSAGDRPVIVAEAVQPDEKLWNSIKGLSMPDLIEQFIKRYPESKYRGEAEARLKELSGGQTRSASDQANELLQQEGTEGADVASAPADAITDDAATIVDPAAVPAADDPNLATGSAETEDPAVTEEQPTVKKAKVINRVKQQPAAASSYKKPSKNYGVKLRIKQKKASVAYVPPKVYRKPVKRTYKVPKVTVYKKKVTKVAAKKKVYKVPRVASSYPKKKKKPASSGSSLVLTVGQSGGGGGGSGGGGGGWSDSRLKVEIVKLDTLENGIAIYAFNYRWDDKVRHVGVMAQDVIAHGRGDAVNKTLSGYYKVDYAALGLKMTTLEDYTANGLSAVLAN